MSSNVKRDHHNLRRNLKLNGKYISNDGGDEGITVNDSGGVTLSAGGAVTGGLSVDYNLSDDASHLSGFQGLLVDADITGAFSQTNVVTGISSSINLTEAVGGNSFLFGMTNATTVGHAADSGSIITVGLTNSVVVSNANASSLATGISNIVTGGDANIGFDQKVTDGDIDIKLKSSADTADYFSISTGGSGATTIATIDSDNAEAAHLTLDIQGDTIFKGDIADGTSTEVARIDASASSLLIADSKKIELGAAEEFIYGDGTDIHIGVGSSGDINIPASIGLTFGNDGEKIEGDGNDLAILSSRSLNITLAANMAIVVGDGDTAAWGIKNQGATTHFAHFGGEIDNYSLLRLNEQGGSSTNDYFQIQTEAAGATTISTIDASGAVAHLTLDPDGDINLNAIADVNIPADIGLTFGDAGEKIEGDGSHLTISSSASVKFDTGLNIDFQTCAAGFTLGTPTYNASDTDVDFGTGNKQFVTFGAGNITDLNLIFPKVTGNFVLMLKQDGTGSRTVTNYKVWDRSNSVAASGSATVKFAGGSNPDLTDDANHVDIISFFYDDTNEIAYGVASLDFQF